ncbi:5' nucleotidase, NT5C type [Solibacillus daqui]|uniref:5' nucleotidase, NT5C type n=1 Tax=Solibacillus daqui TaxID=2912187 RepID=UPI00236688B7|nr:HAD family acid phosphatase [Solibacillus daqui]
MKFGFDIDDTLIDLRRYAFHLYNKKLKMAVNEAVFDQIPTVEIHGAFGMTSEQGSQMWKDSMQEIYFTNCPSFQDAKEVLNALADAGHEIYYITSRPKEYCQQTREWVKAQGFPVVDERFYCGMQDHEKIDIIKSLELDVYVDDKPAVLNTLANTTTKVIVKNQSYNQEVDYIRLTNWHEFNALLK